MLLVVVRWVVWTVQRNTTVPYFYCYLAHHNPYCTPCDTYPGMATAGFSKDEPSLFRRRAVELKHGRVRGLRVLLLQIGIECSSVFFFPTRMGFM